MTEEERANRNPAPEICSIKKEDLHELKIADLEKYKVYILGGRTTLATFNYMGAFTVFGVKAYKFHGPRADLNVVLCERPDNSGTLEDGSGLKVTIYRYDGDDQ